MIEVTELTPRGRAGVSVLCVRGPGAPAAVARLSARGAPASGAPLLAGEPLPPAPRLVRLRGGAGLIDVALCVERGPDEVELHVHGSPILVRLLLDELAGAAPAPPARAEDQALELCSAAASEAAARMLLDQAEGALRRALSILVLAEPARWRAGLDALAGRARFAAHLVRPPRVVLAGPVNAGKSTLFNALLGRTRVVASPEAGTTRDAVEELVLLGRYAARLFDTAGERDARAAGPAAEVERAGQDLARDLAAEAELVLWLAPPGAPPPAAVGRARLAVLGARGDLPGAAPGSLRPLEDPLAARAAVERAFHLALDLPEEPWTPGAAVPFTPELADGLARLRPLVATATRRAAAAELLGPPPLGAPVPAR